jgi:ATP-dependent helicase/nuclease subunit A
VLDVVNTAFASVWDDYPPLTPGRAAEEVSEGPRVDLLIVDSGRGHWDEFPDDGFGDWMLARKATKWRAAETRLLARRIDELAGPGRPYAYGDVAVLLRATRDMDVYERALTDRGIPTYATGGGGYWSQQQIADLRAYLAALANPRDERSLYTLLGSPLVGASLDALALIRFRAGVKGRWQDAWTVLAEAFLEGDGADGLAEALSGADRDRIARFVREFADEREGAARMSLETLIDRAVTSSGYDRAILQLPEGARRMANVRKLMRLAREYEAESGRDLRGFIDFVDEQELLQAREGEAPIEGEGLDAVRLMTVHAAKGLEFPVVCVADLGRAARNEQGPLQVSSDGRVGLQLESLGGGKVSAPEWERIKAERDAADEQEEKRIFYVAMTRAEEHLVVSGATDTEKWPEPQPLGVPMEWAWRALGEAGDRVRRVELTPADIDAVLPLADRIPEPPAPDADEEVRVTSRPAFAPVADGVPLPVARLSYSALESYKRCGYRFYLERVVGMRRAEVREPAVAGAGGAPDGDGQLALDAPAAAPETVEPRVRGTVVHELLEAVDFRRPAPPTVDAVARKLGEHGAPAGQAEELAALVARALESPVVERLRAARRVRAELPFAFELAAPGAAGEPLVVDGFLDVHAEEDAGALVVDYKTDALRGRDPEEATAEKYAAQRLVYALAALRAGAPHVEVVHLFLERADAPASVEYSAADVPELERSLLALADGIVSARFRPAGEPHRELCQGCPGQPALCTWGPDRTLAERPEGETFGDPEPVDVRAGVA